MPSVRRCRSIRAGAARSLAPAIQIVAALVTVVSASDAAERRALWVVRDALLNPESIETMVEDASGAGITDLIVQVRGRGDAYYRSDLVPAAPPLRDAWRRHGDYDPLDLTLRLAHARGLRVHAWLNVYLVSSTSKLPAGHVALTHPDWIAENASGTSMHAVSRAVLERELTEGAYLDPGRTDVRRHFAAVVRELAERYPVDGVHLDYVRYPHMSVGYSPAMLDAFYRRTGVDAMELAHNRPGLTRERGAAELRRLDAEWAALRAEQVTALVRDVRYTLRATRPGVMLSAAVKPDPEGAVSRYGQDWVGWIHEDLIDVAAPMMYSKSTSTVREQVRVSASIVPPDQVWAGIAVYNQSLNGAMAKIDEARRAGLGGVSIFSYNSLPGGGRSLAKLTR